MSVQGDVQTAMQGFLDEGEIVVHWCATIEVAGPGGRRWLAHRAGGGINGDDNPTAWAALGMLEASCGLARDELRAMTTERDDDDDVPDET